MPCSYEAFVIYNFLSLCLAYVGGPGSVEVKMNGYILAPSWKYTTCCLPPIPVRARLRSSRDQPFTPTACLHLWWSSSRHTPGGARGAAGRPAPCAP